MRFFTPFVTAIVSIVFCDVVLSRSHNSDASLGKRHPRRLDNPSSTDVSVRSDGAVLEKRFGPGMRFSFYDVGLGACGQENSRNDFVVAMNTMQYGSGGHCFDGITITYNGKTAHATVVDECMECPYGALDFSRGLFDYFASETLGYIYGSWEFGSGEPATTSTPKPTTTSKPPPTSTWTPEPTTTTTTTKKTSTSTHTSSPASSSAATSSTPATSTSVAPTTSATPAATPTDVFDLLTLVMVNLGNVAAAGVLVGVSGQ